MVQLGILKGKYADDALALNEQITRAELVTVIIRAYGQEANAALLNGAAAYPDTASHWASGNIAMAQALVEKVGGDAIGDATRVLAQRIRRSRTRHERADG